MHLRAALDTAAITKARDGFEGLRAMGRTTPDILVTDIVMPHVDGLEMLHHVATQPDRPALVIATAFLALLRTYRPGR